jgi:DNA-binding LacI/PurR family transcriptional regulator
MMLATTYDAGRSAEADLTTLSFDFHALGTRAANLLLDLIDGVRQAPVHEVVPTTIQPRGSTARR